MVVMKFGGTSVADQAAIERLIAIVRRQRERDGAGGHRPRGPVVVVSALSGVTDRLLGVAAEAGAGDTEGARHTLQGLRARHLKVAEAVTDGTLREAARADIDREFDELERIADALSVLREVSPRWLDTIAAAGEIVSSRMVAAALASHGLEGVWIDARQAVVTNGDHQAAAPAFPETTAALAGLADPLLATGRVPVLGGFVGATAAGVTTTLGRGGSDYSGAIVGACLGAREIQIWTDVDGMLTADPRVVVAPQVVPHLSFAEASELAYFGAKVLHPATIQPAVARNIPVRILNSKRADAPGTLITAERPPSDRPLTALASKKHVTVVDITSTRMLMAHGFLRRLFEVFERHRTPVDVVTTSEVSVSVTVDDRRRLPAIVEALSEFAEVNLEHDMAIVCAVGEGLQQEPALVGRVLQALGDVPVRLLSQAASRLNITFVIPEADVPRALGRLHDHFFAPAGAVDRRMNRLLLVGHGRMGQIVESLAPAYGFDVVAAVTERDDDAFTRDYGRVDVAIDFTIPEAVPVNLPQLAARGINVVIGTTGWLAHEAALKAEAARAGIGVVASANFSLGMNLFLLLAEDAARRFAARQDVGAWIHELHHAAKKDAPSGTALLLKRAMVEAGYTRDIDVAATRAGSIPGTHTIGFDGPSETVTLTHQVRDRGVFARGALEAARWVVGRRGWFTMRDVLTATTGTGD